MEVANLFKIKGEALLLKKNGKTLFYVNKLINEERRIQRTGNKMEGV